jgi:uncharacterized membrane protein YdjX (TVP38/TMEM64 family)
VLNTIHLSVKRRNLFYLILIILIGFLYSYFSVFQDIFYDLVVVAQKYISRNDELSELFFIIFSALSAMFAPLSSTPLVPGAILIWGKVDTFLFLYFGWMIGHILSYTLARLALFPLVKKLTDFKKINYFKEQLSKKLEFMLVLFFWLASPSEIPGYVLGTLRYPFWKYIAAAMIAEFPFALISIYASEAFLAKNMALFTAIVFFGFFILVTMFYFFKKRLKGLKK